METTTSILFAASLLLALGALAPVHAAVDEAAA